MSATAAQVSAPTSAVPESSFRIASPTSTSDPAVIANAATRCLDSSLDRPSANPMKAPAMGREPSGPRTTRPHPEPAALAAQPDCCEHADVASARRPMVNLLARVPLFEGCTHLDLTRIAALSEERIYPEGQVIVKAGDPGKAFYVITNGKVKVVA